jgi:demethylmenaquinone methyltransferase / 2-methoxy-6-polyprenyl-1,4-benzoquinol methylase
MYNKNDPQSIQRMFGSIAKQYDRTNAILSFNMHKIWNKKLIQETLNIHTSLTYLDLCCGTGEIALNYLKNAKNPCEAYMLDFCPEMLHVAKDRMKDLGSHKLTFLQADAQAIPLTNETIHYATMAYGIRNIPDPEKCFKEVYRVLKSGGKLGILELTQPHNVFLKAGHTVYLNTFLPVMGKVVTSNRDAYQYLCNSIKAFTKPEQLKETLRRCGFKNVHVKPLTGGIATIIVAEKQ